ncbi:MAG TPA: DUF1810 domain-containing protein [Pararobbsia sp.]|nr:DUF1810 domain-containing protein [Pararobbsia sp.]
MSDPFKLHRFVSAQAPVYDQVLAELAAGKKRTHWMWFVFPQIKGLGRSEMAETYAIASREEAHAYLHHPVLGERIREVTRIVNELEDRTIEQIFGYPDELKFRSSMTLFAEVAEDDNEFDEALDKYFEGEADPKTLHLMR